MNEELWLSYAEPSPMLEFLQGVASDRKLRLFACACCRRIWDLITTPCSRTAIEVAEQFADGLASEQERFAAFAMAIQEANGWSNCCGAIDAAYSAGVTAAAFAVSERETVQYTGNAVIMAESHFPAFMDTPTTIAPFEASGGAGAAAGAWVQVEEERDDWEYEEHAEWEHTVVTTGKAFAAAVGISAYSPDLDWLQVQRKVQEVEEEAQCDLLRDIFGNPFRPIVFSPAWRTDAAMSLPRQMYESRDFSAMQILGDALQDAGCDNDDVLNHCRDAKQVHVRGCWVVDLLLGKE